MLKRLRFLFDDTVPAAGFALFRMVYALVLLCEVGDLFRFRHLIFDLVPYLRPYEVSFEPLLLAWLLVIVMLGIGFRTRTMAAANYCFTLITFSAFSAFEYHIDYIYTATNILLIFLPVSNRMSVDAWLMQRRTGHRPPAMVSRIYRDAVLFCCIGLVYFDSVLFKMSSPMWRAGLGLWLPASYPHATWLDLSWLLDNRALVLLLGFGTILFEALFIFVMWSRRWQLPLMLVGAALHAGIVLAFPIPWFGLAVVGMYLLMLPDSLINRLFPVGDASAIEHHSDQFSRRAVAVIMVASLLFQLPSMINAPYTQMLAVDFGMKNLWEKVARPLRPWTSAGRPFLGTTPHPVFMDMHFAGYDHELAIIYEAPNGQEVWLPVIDQQGRAGAYNSGRLWVNWTFRVCNPRLETEMVRRGVSRMTAFWAGKNRVSLADSSFRIVAREYDRPTRWEAGFGQRQTAKPWTTVGTVKWTQGRSTLEFQNPDQPPALTDARSPAHDPG